MVIRNWKPKKAKNISSSEDGIEHSSKSVSYRKVEIESTEGFKEQDKDNAYLINTLVTITVDVEDTSESENAVHKRIDSSAKIDKVCLESWKSETMKNCKKRFRDSVLMGTEESSEISAQLKEYPENDSENDDFILDSKLTNLPVSDEDKILCVYHWIRKASRQKNKLSDIFLRTLKD